MEISWIFLIFGGNSVPMIWEIAKYMVENYLVFINASIHIKWFCNQGNTMYRGTCILYKCSYI